MEENVRTTKKDVLKIHNSWATLTKRDENMMSYDILINRHRIARMEVTDTENYDVIIKQAGSNSVCAYYEIVKNEPNLSDDELALICDKGNLSFGYVRKSDGKIAIYTD